jgi:hypothetical protein
MAQVIFKTSEKFKHVQSLRAGQTIADHSYEKLDQSDLLQLSLAFAERASARYGYTPASQRGNAEKIKATIEALKNFNVSEETFEKELDQWHDLILSIQGISLDGEWTSPKELKINISFKDMFIGTVFFCPTSYIKTCYLDVPENFWRRLYFSELFKIKPWTEDQLWSAVKSDNWTNSIWDYVETH